jgi:hypothetical protein
MGNQCGDVRCHLPYRVGPRRDIATADAAVIKGNDTVPTCQRWDDGVVTPAVCAESGYEQERRSLTGFLVVN